jgi:peptide methionine sulfoxide reductase MsrB
MAPPPPAWRSCHTPIQASLRWHLSTFTSPDVPVALPDNETLADAVCCDTRAAYFAEPQNLYRDPRVKLFPLAEAPTTFRDSACGLPLFHAPLNRSLDDFHADTNEHGWPSFRQAEVVKENVRVDPETGFVFSTCGTHLGTYLPDAHGPRWCIDLVCIAGHEKEDFSAISTAW